MRGHLRLDVDSVYSDESDGQELLETRWFPTEFGSVAAEQLGSMPWVVFIAAGKHRDYSPDEALGMADAIVQAANYATAMNLRDGLR